MRLYVNAKTLSNALALTGRAISNKPTHPILGCVRLRFTSEQCQVISFDLATLISQTIPIDNAKGITADICVPYQLFSSVIGKLDGDLLFLHRHETGGVQRLIIESENGRYEMACHNPDDYPDLPAVEGDTIQLAGDTLREAITTVASSVNDDNTKQILCGVNLQTDKGTLYFNATNGHTLARYWSEGCQDDLSITIPVHALLAVSKGTDGDVAMTMDAQQVKFESGDLVIVSRVLDGAFPAVSQLIPVEFERKIKLDATKLKSAMGRISVFNDPKNNLVIFALEDGKLTVKTSQLEVGQGQETIPCDYEGELFEIAFNLKYVSHGIASLNSKEVTLSLNAINQPAVMKSDNNSLFLLMPVQIVR